MLCACIVLSSASFPNSTAPSASEKESKNVFFYFTSLLHFLFFLNWDDEEITLIEKKINEYIKPSIVQPIDWLSVVRACLPVLLYSFPIWSEHFTFDCPPIIIKFFFDWV